MKSVLFLSKSLCLPAILAVCFESCSFREEIPALRHKNDLACFSSILVGRTGTPSSSGTDTLVSVKSLDIFIYDTEGDGPLDSYEHLDLADSTVEAGTGISLAETLEVSSRCGEKDVVVAANLDASRLSYLDVLTYSKLSQVESSLYDEDGLYPVMVGECRIDAGQRSINRVDLHPLTAQIRIRSFEVDFSGTGYGGLTLENIKAYIVNANASCTLIPGECGAARDFINLGRFDQSCTASLKTPGFLFCDTPGLKDCRLHCYPCTEGPPGNENPTMLVIEGVLDGQVCYYPFKIGDGTVCGATDYVFDIKIGRRGASTPYEPIRKDGIEVDLHVENWTTYDWEEENY